MIKTLNTPNETPLAHALLEATSTQIVLNSFLEIKNPITFNLTNPLKKKKIKNNFQSNLV